jgi:two-component system response regulator YesN
MHKITHLALFYLVDNFNTITSIPQIASAIGCNYNTLRIAFKNDLGKSLSNVLNMYRCDQAINFLHRKNMKLNAVAEKVGFHTDKYFISVFKKYYNLTPLEYIKRRYSYIIYSCRGPGIFKISYYGGLSPI